MNHNSVFLFNLHYFYAQTDGSYAIPSSADGDLLKQAKKEIERLHSALDVARRELTDQATLNDSQSAKDALEKISAIIL